MRKADVRFLVHSARWSLRTAIFFSWRQVFGPHCQMVCTSRHSLADVRFLVHIARLSVQAAISCSWRQVWSTLPAGPCKPPSPIADVRFLVHSASWSAQTTVTFQRKLAIVFRVIWSCTLPKLHWNPTPALVYDILPPATALTGYVIALRKLCVNWHFLCVLE